MEKIIKCILILLCCVSCIHNKKIEGFIEIKDEIKKETITSVTINRGILSLNENYRLFSNCSLVYKDSFPNWIQDHDKPDFSVNEYVFEPFITDIDAPYLLYKNKNEDFFYVIKNNDTLKFKLGNF